VKDVCLLSVCAREWRGRVGSLWDCCGVRDVWVPYDPDPMSRLNLCSLCRGLAEAWLGKS